MSVQFEDNNYNFSYKSPEPKGIIGWMIKKGFAKDESGAKKLAVIITVACFVLTLIRILI